MRGCAKESRAASSTTLRKGRPLFPPLGLVGGVSLNRKIASSLEALLGMDVIVPKDSHLAGAVGAALLGNQRTLDIESLAGRAKAAARGSRPSAANPGRLS